MKVVQSKNACISMANLLVTVISDDRCLDSYKTVPQKTTYI